MIVVKTIKELQSELKGKNSIALVPTRGNIHAGHLALMARAKQCASTVVTSIFVNRLQFGSDEDFDIYPRTLEDDVKKLEEQGADDIVFAPSEKELFSESQTLMMKPDPKLANILEGYYRPGFFDGVATVVNKLFSIVRPNVAVFGKKDYQQLKVIQKMVKQFGMPIEIIPQDTERNERTRLAFSSRNSYLSEQELTEAPVLYMSICMVKAALEAGEIDLDMLEQEAMDTLTSRGWNPDYVVIARQDDLLAPTRDDLVNKTPLVVLAAAKIGTTRLIDNIEVF